MSKTKLRKLMIIIEETGADRGSAFNVYLSGDVERLKELDYDLLSPAEFWGSKLFGICIDTLQNAGVIKNKTKPEVH